MSEDSSSWPRFRFKFFPDSWRDLEGFPRDVRAGAMLQLFTKFSSSQRPDDLRPGSFFFELTQQPISDKKSTESYRSKNKMRNTELFFKEILAGRLDGNIEYE